MASLAGRALEVGELDALLLGVRLLVPVLLAAGGHLCARHRDDRGPVLLAALALLLLEALVVGVRYLVRQPGVSPLALAGVGQSALGVLAGAVAWRRRGASAWTRRGAGTDGATLWEGLPRERRGMVVAPLVLLALAALYPSVAGPEVGALQPLVTVLGGAAGLSTVAAAVGIVLLAPVAARASAPAGALALGALAVLSFGRGALHLEDVFAQRVAGTVWLWLELLAAVALLAFSGRILAAPRQ